VKAGRLMGLKELHHSVGIDPTEMIITTMLIQDIIIVDITAAKVQKIAKQ
jgi:hypothetical protein